MSGPHLVTTATGVAVLHLFHKVPGPGEVHSSRANPSWRADVGELIDNFVDDEHQLVCVAMLGHKCDVGFMALGPDVWRLRNLQRDLGGAGLELVDSYVSMTEVSEYAAGLPAEMLSERLNPTLPPEGKRAFCFYPMSKRRAVGANWFRLDYDERRDLMYEHGSSGRKFKGRITQVVTGSTGVDDYEWGVTLFAQHLDDLKDVVYTMRYDEASALYGEFGSFFTGLVDTPDAILKHL